MSRTKKQNSNFQVLKDLVALTKGHRWIFYGAIAALACAVGFEAAGKLVIRSVIDRVFGDGMVPGGLLKLVLLFLVFAGAQALFSLFAGRGKIKTAENITKENRERLFDHIQRLSFSYHDRKPVGELVQRSTSDVDAVRRFYAEMIPGFLRILFLFIINFVALTTLDIRLALFGSIIAPVIAGISLFFFGRIYKAYEGHQKQEGVVSSLVQENLHGIRVIRAFASQDRENKKFEKQNKIQMEKGLRVMYWHALYWPIAHTLCGLQFAGAMVFSGILAIRGEISVGTMIASTFLFTSLIWPMQELGRMITEISHSIVSFKRINEILMEGKEESRDSTVISSGRLKGAVDFRNIGFSYVEDAPVLHDISFSCRVGEKIALVGETGSGKSTIVNLLPRFYDFDSGELLLDGRPLNEYSRTFLRRSIGIVEQNPFLFTMTIRENISYSVEREVPDEDIVAVARAASIHENIMEFPRGYETLVGEKGVSLSGGQKQRITIARTLLKDPSILILDDSTSAVDADTESSIQSAMEELMKNRTTFIIAHRLQTLRQADNILVLKKGRIIQSGKHEELVSVDGMYKKIHRIQTRIEEDLVQELGRGAQHG
jgi:ATP-binding cassette, subfamily B, bacterial